MEELGSTGGVVAEGKELVSGDATVDCKQRTSLVCMMLTGFGCKFILGGVTKRNNQGEPLNFPRSQGGTPNWGRDL